MKKKLIRTLTGTLVLDILLAIVMILALLGDSTTLAIMAGSMWIARDIDRGFRRLSARPTITVVNDLPERKNIT